jgi:hypothetical protein
MEVTCTQDRRHLPNVTIQTSQSYDRSIAFSKASSPQSAIQCVLFQFSISSLFLKVIQ